MDIITGTRILEDTLGFVLLSIALFYLVYAVVKLKGIPIRSVPLALTWGILPLYIWKSMGMIRRVFLDKMSNPDLYELLHEIGEVFESLSGLVLAIAFFYILMRLRRLSTIAE